jgi:hypothetical protein
MPNQTTKSIPLQKFLGKTIEYAHIVNDVDPPESFSVCYAPGCDSVGVVAPSKEENFSFDLSMVAVNDPSVVYHMVLLDPCANSFLSEKMVRRFFGCAKSEYTLAVDRDSGDIYLAYFQLRKSLSSFGIQKIPSYGIRFEQLMVSSLVGGSIGALGLPKKYLKHLDAIKSSPRPFRLSCSEWYLWEFIAHEASLSDLRDNLYIEFRFGDKTVKVG